MKIPKKKSAFVANKAWSLLRLALLWARKVPVLKRRLKIKGLRDKTTHPSKRIRYFERQLSFDRTPDFRLKKYRSKGYVRFLFPCVGTKEIEFKSDFHAAVDDGVYANGSRRESYSVVVGEEEEEESEDCEKKSQVEEESIDSRAEKFIAEFYEQKKIHN